jgi:hypothetical protein
MTAPTQAEPTEPTEPTQDEVTEEPTADAAEAAPTDGFAVPAEITTEYVDRVLVELDARYGAAIRDLQATGTVGPGFLDELRTAFDPTQVEEWAEVWRESLDEIPNFAQPAGDPATSVIAPLRLEPDCVLVLVSRDLAPLYAEDDDPPAPGWFMALAPKPAEADPAGRNPTPWWVVLDMVTANGEPPEVVPCG